MQRHVRQIMIKSGVFVLLLNRELISFLNSLDTPGLICCPCPSREREDRHRCAPRVADSINRGTTYCGIDIALSASSFMPHPPSPLLPQLIVWSSKWSMPSGSVLIATTLIYNALSLLLAEVSASSPIEVHILRCSARRARTHGTGESNKTLPAWKRDPADVR